MKKMMKKRHLLSKIYCYQINDNLEKQAQAIFKSWFVDFEPFQDGEFVDSELGMIPKGWRIINLSELLYISKESINPSKNSNVLYYHYSLPAFDNGKMPEMQYGKDILSNKFVLSNNTILFSKLNPRIKRIWYIDEVCDNSICSTEFITYKTKDPRLSYFAYCLINSELFYQNAMALVNGSTGSHQRFNPKDTMNFKIAINDDILLQFSNIIAPLIKKESDIITESYSLSNIRDTLLPKLISGKLSVEDI